MMELVNEDVVKCLTFFATNADVETRKQYVKVLLQILNKPMSTVLEDIHKIASTLILVSEDLDKSVRENLVARIPEIYTRCHELASPDLEYFLYDRLLDIVLRCLKDNDVEVSCKAYTTTICLLQKYLLDKNRIEQKLCPAIIELSKYNHENHTVDYQVNSIELMKLMAPIIGPEKTQELLLGRFLEMCSMDLHYLRKSCAEYFPVFCQVMGIEITESLLLPAFVNLCEDCIWSVRKTAAGSMLKVALMCSVECRRDTLAPMMYRLLNDTSRWVGMIAFECLGQFISLFAQPCITGLTYTDHGELYITNAANPDFKHQCNINLIQNYAFYERIFEKSMTPNAISGALSQHSNINNNNYYLKTKTGQNPLKQFMSPQQYDDVGMSTIEKISRRLEMFYGTETKPDPAVPNNATATTSKHVPPPTKTGDPNAHAINNNPEATTTDTPDQTNKPTPTTEDATLNNNNNPAESTPEPMQPLAKTTTADVSNSNTTATVTGSSPTSVPAVELRQTGKNKKKSKAKALLAQQQQQQQQEIKENIKTEVPNANIILMNGDSSAESHQDLSSSSSSGGTSVASSHAVRKNTPADLPMIIKQAIEHKDANVSSRKKRKSGMLLNISLAKDAPPETPAIESAPQAIDFKVTNSSDVDPNSLADEISDEMEELNKSMELQLVLSDSSSDQDSESDFNKAINAMQYEDAFEEKLSAMLPQQLDDSDEVDPEFTGANYWYIRPEFLPLNTCDIFPETNSLERQFNSVTVNNIYNESMDPNADILFKNADDIVVDDTWTNQLSKLQRNGGLHENSQYNRPFKQDILPPFLIRYFISMVRFNDSVMNMHCVYNFPAVVLTLGPQHWHMTHNLLLVLCDDLQWKIRKTVAVFIYQIGLIIGRELAGKDLVPIFMGFFKDLDEVKIEALRNLTSFLQVVDIQHHHKIIFRLGCCLNTDNYANWRFREELAQQVLSLIQMYGSTYNVDGMIYLTGIAINLLSDEVCSVREIALNGVVATFKVSSSGHITDLISLLTDEFAVNNFWRKRQMYIHICHKLITENVINFELFESAFLDSLLNLANDSVPNIRLNVAKILSKAMIGHEYFSGRPIYEDIVAILDKLKSDPDRDVRFMAGPSDNLDDFDPTNANLEDFDGEW